MLIFNNFKCPKKRVIVFLCGTQYKNNSPNDKRVVLERYLKEKFVEIDPVILEEHFVFGKRSGYLSYDDIYMKSLADVEIITASFADGVIIVHDSISTGAELAAFAVNEFIEDKICVMEPDSTGIEERKISSFLKLAFFGNASNIKRIIYYPEVYDFHLSENHIEKRTNFPENRIPRNLGTSISQFINQIEGPLNIIFEEACFNKIKLDKSIISFFFTHDDVAEVHVPGQVFFYQVVSLFQLTKVRSELRQCKELRTHIDCLSNYYKKIMLATINSMGKRKGVKLDVYIKEYNKMDRKIIGYSMYMMQALDLIEISNIKSSTQKTIKIKNKMRDYLNILKDIVIDKKDDLAGLLDG